MKALAFGIIFVANEAKGKIVWDCVELRHVCVRTRYESWRQFYFSLPPTVQSVMKGFCFNLAPVGIWQQPLFRLWLSIFVTIILLDYDGGQ